MYFNNNKNRKKIVQVNKKKTNNKLLNRIMNKKRGKLYKNSHNQKLLFKKIINKNKLKIRKIKQFKKKK